jgi:hypothetical protein
MSTSSATPQLSKSSKTTSESTFWLKSLGLTRDNQTWTYSLNDGQISHQFPVSVTGVISAVTKTPEQIEQIMATKHIWEPRGNTVHLALQHFVEQRWNPASTWTSPPNLTSDEYRPYADYIEPLLAHQLWEKVTPVGSEVMAYCLKRNVAGTADLVVRFDDGTYALADLKTQGSASSKPYDTKPQLGAGVHLVGDRYRLYFSRCLTIWARPGSVQIQTHDTQACLDAWWDVLDTYEARFRQF